MNYKDFLFRITQEKISNHEITAALIWSHQTCDDGKYLTIKELCKEIEEAGFGRQNSTRLKNALRKDKRIIKNTDKSVRVSPKALRELNNHYSKHLDIKPKIKSDSILEAHLFSNSRKYIKSVVQQLNVSYEYGLFDCCAVMCRRLLESLIIDSYEENKCESEIRNGSGNYCMFSGLLSVITKNNVLNIGRNTIKELKAFKKLGDLSAHSRRYNARKSDIDSIKDGLRISSEELLHLSKQI